MYLGPSGQRCSAQERDQLVSEASDLRFLAGCWYMQGMEKRMEATIFSGRLYVPFKEFRL